MATSIGRLRFARALDLVAGEYLTFRDIVVLDTVPNDLAVTLGIITQEFQTPLSHVNVLSQTRKIPNMALRKAFTDSKLRALEGKWVKLTVGATSYTIEEKTLAEADAWWEANKPKGVTIPAMDTSVTGLVDVKNVLDPALSLSDGLKKAVLAFGGKGTHYAAMSAKDLVPMPKPPGFIIPVYYYDQFLKQNGFDKEIDALLADAQFRGDPRTRDTKLAELRAKMEAAPADPAFEAMLNQKLNAEYREPADSLPLQLHRRGSGWLRRGWALHQQDGRPERSQEDPHPGHQEGVGQRLVLPGVRGARLPQRRPEGGGHGGAGTPFVPDGGSERRGPDRQSLRPERAATGLLHQRAARGRIGDAAHGRRAVGPVHLPLRLPRPADGLPGTLQPDPRRA